MALSESDRLGPYEIVSPLGAGGMGEVYKARDSRLDRVVALKVSKSEFTDRFSREARTVAQLNHANICTLHDVGPNYLVMEFVDGVPLQGPLPLAKVLEYAYQILDALDAAHRRGIVHRDLKPANILVTKSGIKLLDFGLAKQAAPSLGPNEATVVSIQTVEGEISGTLQYMAPEQLEGKPADPRSDIFAFGLILYELLTGKRAFDSPTQAGVIASILKEQPRPVRELQPLASTGLERIVETCLEKDPDKRWQSAREVRHALEWMTREGPVVASPVERTKSPRVWQIATAVLGLTAIGLAAWLLRPKQEAPSPITRFPIPLPEHVAFGNYVSFSPDGRKLVISTASNDGLWIRDLDALEWRKLSGTENTNGIFWSPDSRYIGFAVQNELKKIDVNGGPPQTLCSAPILSAGSGSWNRDGVIVFGGRAGSPLWRVPEAGGVPTPVTALDTSRGESFHALPVFLPDGKHFIYFRQGGPDVSGIYAGSLDTKPADQPKTRLLAARFAASFVNGSLFFMRENTLMAQPFDIAKLALTGEPIPVAEHIALSGATGVFSVSAAGALAFRPVNQASTYQLTWMDRQGKSLGTMGQPGSDLMASLSPDGTRAVVRDAATGSAGLLWTIDLARNIRSPFTFQRATGSWGVWSPDGSRIVYSGGTNFDTIFERASSGTGEEKTLLKESISNHAPYGFSPDGRLLLYWATSTPKNANDIWALNLDGSRKPIALLATQFSEAMPALSPDMRWLAYVSNESGRDQIYVRPFIASGPSLGEGKWQISRDGGDTPRWTSDGRQIIFEEGQHAIMSVDVRTNGTVFEPATPQRLFPFVVATEFSWDMTRDGKRFLVAVPQNADAGEKPITVVLNWPTLLKPKR
jgi:eukaryotic-like serine/threonine-protein kinase